MLLRSLLFVFAGLGFRPICFKQSRIAFHGPCALFARILEFALYRQQMKAVQSDAAENHGERLATRACPAKAVIADVVCHFPRTGRLQRPRRVAIKTRNSRLSCCASCRAAPALRIFATSIRSMLRSIAKSPSPTQERRRFSGFASRQTAFQQAETPLPETLANASFLHDSD